MGYLIGPEANRAAVCWLREHSKRPIAAMNLWSLLLANLDPRTGQVLLSRGELAGEVGITPREVTYIMKELDGIGAISRQSAGRGGARYFINELYFTAAPGEAQKEDPRQMTIFEFLERKLKEAKDKLLLSPDGKRPHRKGLRSPRRRGAATFEMLIALMFLGLLLLIALYLIR